MGRWDSVELHFWMSLRFVSLIRMKTSVNYRDLLFELTGWLIYFYASLFASIICIPEVLQFTFGLLEGERGLCPAFIERCDWVIEFLISYSTMVSRSKCKPHLTQLGPKHIKSWISFRRFLERWEWKCVCMQSAFEGPIHFWAVFLLFSALLGCELSLTNWALAVMECLWF